MGFKDLFNFKTGILYKEVMSMQGVDVERYKDDEGNFTPSERDLSKLSIDEGIKSRTYLPRLIPREIVRGNDFRVLVQEYSAIPKSDESRRDIIDALRVRARRDPDPVYRDFAATLLSEAFHERVYPEKYARQE